MKTGHNPHPISWALIAVGEFVAALMLIGQGASVFEVIPSLVGVLTLGSIALITWLRRGRHEAFDAADLLCLKIGVGGLALMGGLHGAEHFGLIDAPHRHSFGALVVLVYCAFAPVDMIPLMREMRASQEAARAEPPLYWLIWTLAHVCYCLDLLLDKRATGDFADLAVAAYPAVCAVICFAIFILALRARLFFCHKTCAASRSGYSRIRLQASLLQQSECVSANCIVVNQPRD